MAYRRLTIASAVALAVATTGSVHAADSNSIEEIVVTATKREEILKNVAMGISAVSGADLVRRNETGVLGWAAQVPGLSLEVANPGAIRLVLRGANFGSVGATVATVIDDIPFSMTGAQTNGWYVGANVDTYDLQRVEVLRGPQCTL
ncbi:MAG: TonB-dependent receptor plug domain-containing protein [Gammaproteobacteria bacterium]